MAAGFLTPAEYRAVMKPTGLYRFYKRFRASGMRASHALSSARTLAEWEGKDDDAVRLRLKFDECADTSWMSARQLESWDGEAFGVIGEYRCSSCDSWIAADSVWGCIGYADPLDPFENWYVPDIMRETLNQRLLHELGVIV